MQAIGNLQIRQPQQQGQQQNGQFNQGQQQGQQGQNTQQQGQQGQNTQQGQQQNQQGQQQNGQQQGQQGQNTQQQGQQGQNTQQGQQQNQQGQQQNGQQQGQQGQNTQQQGLQGQNTQQGQQQNQQGQQQNGQQQGQQNGQPQGQQDQQGQQGQQGEQTSNHNDNGSNGDQAGDGDRNGQNQDNNGDRNGNGNDQNQNDDGNRNGEDNNGNRNGDQDGDRNGQNNGDNNDRGGNSQQQNSQGSDRQNGDSGTSGINGGAKTGIIVGGSVGAVAILAILVYILWRKRRGASFADIVRFRKPSEDVVVEKGNNNGAVLPIYRQDRFSVRTDQPDMLKSVPDAPFAAASARSDRGSVVEPTLWKSANPPMPSPVEEQKIESVEETKDSSAWPLGDRSPTLVNDSPTSDAVHHTLPSRDRAQPPRFELRRSGSSLGLAPPAHNPVYSTSDNNDRIRTADTVATSSAPKAKRWSRTNVSRNSSVNSRKNPASLAKARNLTNWATRQDKGARQHQQHSQGINEHGPMDEAVYAHAHGRGAGTIHTATSTTVTKAPPLKNHAVKPILAPPPSAAKRAAAQKKSSPSRPNIERHHRVGSLSMIFKPVSSDSSKDGSPKSPKSPVEPPPALNMTGDAVRLREMDAGDARRRSSVRQSYTRGFGSYGGPQHGGGDGAGRNGLLPSTGYDSRYHHQRGGGSTVSGSTVTGDDFPPPPAEHAVSPLMEDELRGGTWS